VVLSYSTFMSLRLFLKKWGGTFKFVIILVEISHNFLVQRAAVRVEKPKPPTWSPTMS